jgi:transposase
MGKIKEIKINNIEEIETIIKRDVRYRVRNRANAILYKFKLYKVEEIAKLLKVRPQTVYLWIRKYEKDGIESFYDKKGRGRKETLKVAEVEEIKALVLNQPSLTVANAKIREKLNIYVHNETLRQYLKKNKIQLYTGS